MQVVATKDTGFAVIPGYSGTPVWDVEKKGVIGMVLASEGDLATKIGYIISTKMIETKLLSLLCG